MNCGTSSDNTFREIIDAETFERVSLEMTRKDIVGIVVGEDPVVKDCEIIFIAEVIDERLTFISLTKHFGRIEALKQFVDIFVITLCEIELARRDV